MDEATLRDIEQRCDWDTVELTHVRALIARVRELEEALERRERLAYEDGYRSGYDSASLG